MSNKFNILNIARPTPGDSSFCARWESLGEVDRKERKKNYHFIVVDQHVENCYRLHLTHPDAVFCSATTGHTHLDGIPRHQIISLRGEYEFLKSIRGVSEWVFEMILNYYKRSLRQNVSGKRIGIIGQGRIGTHVAELAKTFHMERVFWDKNVSESILEHIFETSDIISIHIEENEQTIGIIDDNLIRRMKNDAMLINSSRPSLVDQNALLRHINHIHVAMDFEPIEPLKELVIWTPHLAGSSTDDRIRTDEFLVKKVKDLCTTPNKKLKMIGSLLGLS